MRKQQIRADSCCLMSLFQLRPKSNSFHSRDFPGGQWIRHRASPAGDRGSIHGRETKIPQAAWRGQKNRKNKQKIPSTGKWVSLLKLAKPIFRAPSFMGYHFQPWPLSSILPPRMSHFVPSPCAMPAWLSFLLRHLHQFSVLLAAPLNLYCPAPISLDWSLLSQPRLALAKPYLYANGAGPEAVSPPGPALMLPLWGLWTFPVMNQIANIQALHATWSLSQLLNSAVLLKSP